MSKAILIGHATCPECQSLQVVKSDPRKRYYLNCANCGTTSLYQSKKSKSRLEARLKPIEDDEKTTKTVEEHQEIERTVDTKGVSFLDALSDFLAGPNENKKHG